MATYIDRLRGDIARFQKTKNSWNQLMKMTGMRPINAAGVVMVRGFGAPANMNMSVFSTNQLTQATLSGYQGKYTIQTPLWGGTSTGGKDIFLYKHKTAISRGRQLYKFNMNVGLLRAHFTQKIAEVSDRIKMKNEDITRILNNQRAAAAARKREAEATKAAAEAQARQAKIVAAQKKQLEDMAAARLREAEARTREKARSKEIAAARAREVLRAKNIADARAREAKQAKEIARARVREANKTASAVVRAKILEDRQSTLARGAAASAKISAIRARADEAEAGKQDQIALYQEAQAAKLEAERSILNVKEIISRVSDLVREATQAQRISKQMLIAVLKEIDKYDKLARSEYGKAVFEENRAGWMEAIKIAARALPEPDQIEIENASKRKGKFGIVPFLIAGGAAYMYTTMQ